nr:MAG TPA: hypothetical protein [Caudoviricetes sp.]
MRFRVARAANLSTDQAQKLVIHRFCILVPSR